MDIISIDRSSYNTRLGRNISSTRIIETKISNIPYLFLMYQLEPFSPITITNIGK